MSNITIAIDGPSASGKSTAAKNLAEKLKIEYIDTGAMYRAVAYKALQNHIDISDSEQFHKMLENTDIDFIKGCTYLDNEDISSQIRNLEVSRLASEVSKIPECRQKLVELQRKMASAKSVVMDGRDIGTNVLPNAPYKFFVTASVEKRAQRRLAELLAKSPDAKDTYEDVIADLKQRDYNDTTRALNPLRKADNAVEISTDDIDIDQTTELLLSYINK